MFNAFYQGEITTVSMELAKHNSDIRLIKLIGKKGGYSCPYCKRKLMFKSGDVYEKHFAHWNGASCEEARIQEKEIVKHRKHKKRESSQHKTIISIIHDELKIQEKLNENVSVHYGLEFKAHEKWKYYPDLILINNGKEIAISFLTNISPSKDTSLIRNIRDQNKYYQEKGLEIIWFVEEREQAINLENHTIHFWATEVELANTTNEDEKWTKFLKAMRSKYGHSVIQSLNYKLQSRLDLKVKSLYYISTRSEPITFIINRFILDGIPNAIQGFVLNEGYKLEMGQALVVDDYIKLSDPRIEAELRDQFEKKLNEKIQLKKKLEQELEEQRKKEKQQLEQRRKREEQQKQLRLSQQTSKQLEQQRKIEEHFKKWEIELLKTPGDSMTINKSIESIRGSNDKFLYEEALESRKRNPEGPWRDSRKNKWGICDSCGEFTKDYWYFDGATNMCKCNNCKNKNN